MKYRRLDASGDYSFGRGNQDFVTDAYAVGQAIKTKLLMLQGEWWENTEEGLPLFQHILGSAGTPEALNSADLLIRARILETPGVASISNFERTYQNRQYAITCDVETIYGETLTISETF